MSDDQQDAETAEGTVTAFYPSDGENDPYNVYLDSVDGKFSTFDGKTAEPLAEGEHVRFQYVQNGDHRNIVDGSVEVVDDPDVYGSTDGAEPFAPSDARITSQSILRSAVLHHQHREDSTDEDVVATAELFADVQVKLYEKLRAVGKECGN